LKHKSKNLIIMKKIISTNPHYDLSVSSTQNRAFLTIKGFWRNPEQVPEYIEDWKKAIGELKPGFTLVTDARQMVIHPASVRPLHEQAQKLIINAGVARVAEIQKDKIAEMQLNGVSKDTQMPKKNFNDIAEAEKWLDEASAKSSFVIAKGA
jgi:hypothetical protein